MPMRAARLPFVLRGLAVALSLGALLAACVDPAPTEPSATAQSASLSPTAPDPTVVVPGPARPLLPVSVALALPDPVALEDAEDGHLSLAHPVAPIAIDVTADAPWPARALDPVLHVGPLELMRYHYVTPETLRYVLADRGVLPSVADVWVQYGPDERSRVVMASGWVPR